MSSRCYELHLGNRSISLISTRNRAKVLKVPPCLPTAPTAKTSLKLKPMLRRWLITAVPMLSVGVAACNPVDSHELSWLVMD